MTPAPRGPRRTARAGALLGAACLALALACGAPPEPAPARWYRGNTHTHTERSGHGDASPGEVARWYADHGYDFVVLSEHNLVIDTSVIELPAAHRDDFLVLAGTEYGGRRVHVTGLGFDFAAPGAAPPDTPEAASSGAAPTRKTALIDAASKPIRAAGGLVILNHPLYQGFLGAEDIRPAKGLGFIEIYNGHVPTPSVEPLWDALLGDGMRLFGVAADDAHVFGPTDPDGHEAAPGRGWICVRARALSREALREALQAGDFYASSGVVLADVATASGALRVVVDVDETRARLAEASVRGRPGDAGAPPDDLLASLRIDFIGPGGQVLRSVSGVADARFDLDGMPAYVRARVSAARQRGSEVRVFDAWTQPVFAESADAR